jgi:peptide chain release factor 1
MVDLLQEDILRLMGDEETFGLIEEMEDEIVDKILPVREGDKKNSCILEVS